MRSVRNFRTFTVVKREYGPRTAYCHRSEMEWVGNDSFVFVTLHPKSTAKVKADRSVHLTSLLVVVVTIIWF